VLATRHLPPWRVMVWMKLIEAAVQLRPKSLWRVMAHPDHALRAAMRWYYRIGRQVWPYEWWHFLFRDRRTRNGPSLVEFLGHPQSEAEDFYPPLRRRDGAVKAHGQAGGGVVDNLQCGRIGYGGGQPGPVRQIRRGLNDVFSAGLSGSSQHATAVD